MEINEECENPRAAWAWAVIHDEFDALDQTLETLYRFLTLRGRYQEAETLIARALRRIATRVLSHRPVVHGRLALTGDEC
jgi:hypothetical protein